MTCQCADLHCLTTLTLYKHRASIEQVKVPIVVIDEVWVVFFAELAYLLHVLLGLRRWIISRLLLLRLFLGFR